MNLPDVAASGLRRDRNQPRVKLGLATFVIFRIFQAVPLVLLVIAINFALIQLAPGDPTTLLLPENASQARRDQLRHELGLDQPIPVQFVKYSERLLRLDFGSSFRFNDKVMSVIASRIPAELLLGGTAFAFSSIFGVFLGVFAARRANSALDNAATLASLAGSSMPVFWLGQLLLLIFSLGLGWFPSQGMFSLRDPAEGLAQVPDLLSHLVLPALTLGAYPLTLIFRLTRAKMQETLSQDFITTARAKGLSESRVVYRHALPNGFLPVLTVIGYQFGFLLTGSVLVETVFGWPGTGLLLAQAITSRDYPLILGLFTVTSISVIAASLLTDILYALVDPRVRLSSARRSGS